MMRNEKGNAFFIILLGIVLFGILAATISAGFDGSVNLDDDRAQVRVSHILEQETILQNAYKMLRAAHGCKIDEINFSLTASTAYNTNAPSNGKCSMYHPAGGGLSPIKPIEGTQDTLDNTYEEYWVETSALEIDGVGTTASATASCPGCDLAILLYNVDQTVCKRLNLGQFNVKTAYTLGGTETISPRAFDGSFANTNLIDATDDAALVGQKSFCVQEAGGDLRYIYVSVLESR